MHFYKVQTTLRTLLTNRCTTVPVSFFIFFSFTSGLSGCVLQGREFDRSRTVVKDVVDTSKELTESVDLAFDVARARSEGY